MQSNIVTLVESDDDAKRAILLARGTAALAPPCQTDASGSATQQ